MFGGRGGGESHLIELVFLAELHALLPAVIALEEVGSDSPELDQLVLLQALGQRDVVEVVVGIYRCPQGLTRGRWENIKYRRNDD